jgi:hypothetical protein
MIAGMPEPRPLYRLPDLASAKTVYVCEGEKAAEAAWSIGLVATTSAGGAKAARKTAWSPLAGKDVVIFPDNDQAGRSYGDAVAAILERLKPPSVVKVVNLPDVPEGGDVVDWIDAHGDAAEPDELRRQIEALVDAAGSIQPNRPAPAVLPWKPFPVDALPEPVRRFVATGAKAIGCDPSYVALPLFSALASATGATRRIELKPGWSNHR